MYLCIVLYSKVKITINFIFHIAKNWSGMSYSTLLLHKPGKAKEEFWGLEEKSKKGSIFLFSQAPVNWFHIIWINIGVKFTCGFQKPPDIWYWCFWWSSTLAVVFWSLLIKKKCVRVICENFSQGWIIITLFDKCKDFPGILSFRFLCQTWFEIYWNHLCEKKARQSMLMFVLLTLLKEK